MSESNLYKKYEADYQRLIELQKELEEVEREIPFDLMAKIERVKNEIKDIELKYT